MEPRRTLDPDLQDEQARRDELRDRDVDVRRGPGMLGALFAGLASFVLWLFLVPIVLLVVLLIILL
jgi:hypothetical protein